ncbi:MAG: glutamate--cysteine ligase [Bdellovibrionales bacterium]
MNREMLHQALVAKNEPLCEWFREQLRDLSFPIYTSFDVRDAGFKIGPVDANIFPAGFNNICPTDKESAPDVAREFLDDHYSATTKRIVLLTEEHTQNPYYWDNVHAIQTILESAGREVRLAIPRDLPEPLNLRSASGHQMTVHSAKRAGNSVDIEGFTPDLVICNNDFAVEYEEWARGLEIPMNPPRELGWYRRRKDRFFRIYNELVAQVCQMISVDPWVLQVATSVFSNFDVDDENSRDQLAEKAAQLLTSVQEKYREHDITRPPFIFVKNNAGTYGLGVVLVKDAEEIRSWNYKARKKMKAAKGGREVTEVIVQEGIPTTTQGESGQVAEPVIYMIGCQLAGGFLRTHQEKSDDDSLNSPGAVYQKLCVSDLAIKLSGCPMENTYGWIAKLSFLAVAKEARELDVPFRNFRPNAGPCA